MTLVPTRAILDRTTRGRAAFNVVHLETAEALAGAADDTGLPLILQISENCVAYHGALAPVAAGVSAIAQGAGAPIAVHLDHAVSEALALEAIEAELGEIGGKDDALAVAVGSSHAMTDRTAVLDLDLIARLHVAVDVPLVLHGSSGVADENLRAAVAAGIAKVNISTQLTKQYTKAVRRSPNAPPSSTHAPTPARAATPCGPRRRACSLCSTRCPSCRRDGRRRAPYGRALRAHRLRRDGGRRRMGRARRHGRRGRVVVARGHGGGWRSHLRGDAHVVDADGRAAVPGFVDLHCPGGGGASAEDAARDPRALPRILAVHRRHGTTRTMLSLVPAGVDVLAARIAALAPLVATEPLLLGVHLEGPFPAGSHRGAHRADALRPRTALAGSTLTLDRALANAVAAGVPLVDAVDALTATPARVLGLQGRVGSLAPGAAADLVLLGAGGAPDAVWADGALVHAGPTLCDRERSRTTGAARS